MLYNDTIAAIATAYDGVRELVSSESAGLMHLL